MWWYRRACNLLSLTDDFLNFSTVDRATLTTIIYLVVVRLKMEWDPGTEHTSL